MHFGKSLIFILVLFVASICDGAIYYVATNGLDANDGSLANPWLHIHKAAGTAVAGDSVIINAGTYNEWVTNLNSGTPGNLITFTGERGPAGEWLTILDPSTSASNGWVAAPEIGSGVYKLTGMAFTTRELTIAGKRVAYVWTNGTITSDIAAVYNTNWTTGEQLMLLATGVRVAFASYPTWVVDFWDGIEAIYFSTNKTLFLRLRDGSDPTGLPIRASPNSESNPLSNTPWWPAITILNRSNITWKNMLVRGAYVGFDLDGGHDITIESNYVSGGYTRIYLVDGSHHNIIRYNEVSGGWYGSDDTGAWNGGTNETFYVRCALYGFNKYMMGHGSTWCNGIYLNSSGSSNLIMGNHVMKGLGNGISIEGGVTAPIYGTVICSNIIETSSSVGLLLPQGETETLSYGNLFRDNNISIRYHHMDTTGETNRTIYTYRNTFWQPDNIGEHIFFNYSYLVPSAFKPTVWTYHNSFSGGSIGISIGAEADEAGGITNGFVINNIFSGGSYSAGGSYPAFDTNVNSFGAFDYNLIFPEMTDAYAWFGGHNITNVAREWISTSNMVFSLSPTSLAVNAALDIHSTFTLRGRTFSALPDTATQNGTAWDMGALESEFYQPRAALKGKSTFKGKGSFK